jgi:diphthamide biosynthesis protein 2
MGKPNPAKLANFPEIEVFVMVADPQGLLLDSKDYLAPIITPYEAWLAFTGQSLQLPTYRLDPAPLFASSSDSQGAGGVQKGAGAACSSTSSGMAAFGGNIIEDEEEEEDEQVVTGLTVGVSSMSLAVKGGSSMAAPGQQGGQLVAAKTAAEYLTKQRTWQGVDTPATGAELKQAGPAVAGRSGRAAGYVDEPQSAGPSG